MTMETDRIKPRFHRLLLGMVMGLIGGMQAARSDDFGRLFTTPKERERLDEIRNAAASTTVNIKDTELNVNEATEKVEPKHEDIKVKGVVYRSDGKNTAWLNDTNSNEGDVASQYLKVDEHNINPDGVKLVLPGNKKAVHLKVGEAYDSATDKTSDMIPKNDLVK